MPAERQLVRKGEFAVLRGVTPGRVSQWIAAGQISGDALVGEGRDARIDVEIASQQLGVTLDPVQLNAQARQIPVVTAAPAVSAPVLPPQMNDAQQRSLVARAEKDEIAARKAKREEEAARGLYVLTEDATSAFNRTLISVLESLDESIPGFAEALAAEMKIDPKPAVAVLRQQIRAWRARQSFSLQEIAAVEPEFVAPPASEGEPEQNEAETAISESDEAAAVEEDVRG